MQPGYRQEQTEPMEYTTAVGGSLLAVERLCKPIVAHLPSRDFLSRFGGVWNGIPDMTSQIAPRGPKTTDGGTLCVSC
jgi:hypothetical protein